MTVTVNEPDIYGPDSPNSFFRDVHASTLRNNASSEAEERLARYGQHLAGGSTKASAKARAVWREAFRGELRAGERPETRAMTSGPSSAGSLITPEYLTDEYQPWNEFAPSFALATTRVDLPAYGMQVNVPAITATDPAPQQATENTLTEADTTATYRTQANLEPFVGYTDVSQQLFDRAGPTGIDQVIYQQMRQSMWNQIDLGCTAAVIAAVPGGNQLTRATPTTPVTTGLWSDINHAANQIEGAVAGVKMQASHAFLSSTRFRFAAATVDNQGRPIWQPDGGTADFSRGFTGYTIASTGVYTDGTLPSSTNDTYLVANPAATVLAMGDPYLYAYPETKANQLTVVLRLHCYAAPVVRLPGAAATITGAAYPATVTWP